MFTLNDKKALITGGSGGIGAAIAEQFAKSGAEVIITGTNEEKLKNVQEKIGAKCTYLVSNLGNEADLDSLISEHCKDIDLLVCNAGITRDGLLMRMKDEDWNQVIDVNLTSTFKIIRGAIRGMMKKRHGRIINISSVVASSGNPGQANYCASKAGMIGMSKSIALEVASRGITVNCIAPGFIRTSMTDKLTEDQTAQITKNIPNGKMGSVYDIAGAALYLASDAAGYVTGQTIHVNGGLYLN